MADACPGCGAALCHETPLGNQWWTCEAVRPSGCEWQPSKECYRRQLAQAQKRNREAAERIKELEAESAQVIGEADTSPLIRAVLAAHGALGSDAYLRAQAQVAAEIERLDPALRAKYETEVEG